LLDENQLLGAAGQRLQPERAGAGKEIEAARARDMVLQPVEQGLPNPVRRRANLDTVGES
jgi:hypothetical protein